MKKVNPIETLVDFPFQYIVEKFASKVHRKLLNKISGKRTHRKQFQRCKNRGKVFEDAEFKTLLKTHVKS